MTRALRGVNLGGWLVLESWTTPSLFDDVAARDEYSYCQQLTPARRKQLKQFRDTFITEADFIWLAERGIEAVRLPVGYWLFGNYPPYLETVQYVDKAFAWAQKHGIKVLLDLHGAPGSQNGERHSGQAGKMTWHTSEAQMQETQNVLVRIAKRYGSHPALLGIEFLNEPSRHIDIATLETFYQKTYVLMESISQPGTWLICSDAFRHRKWYRKLLPRQFPNILMDYHHYQIYRLIDQHLPPIFQVWRARWLLGGKLRRMSKRHPIIVGEWCGAFKGPANSPEQQKAYIAAQQRAFNKYTAAHFYWNYRTGYGGIWSYKACYERGLIV